MSHGCGLSPGHEHDGWWGFRGTLSGNAAAVVFNTPDEGKCPRPMQCHARSLDDVASATVQRLAQIRGANERRAEVASASAASRHTFQEWEAVACDLLQQKRLTPQQYVSLVDEATPVARAVCPPAEAGASRAEGRRCGQPLSAPPLCDMEARGRRRPSI